MKIFKSSYHRNGVSGVGFYAVTFRPSDDKTKTMFAVVFPGEGQVAVFDLDKLGDHIIEFGKNSWRGDHFETELRKHLDFD